MSLQSHSEEQRIRGGTCLSYISKELRVGTLRPGPGGQGLHALGEEAQVRQDSELEKMGFKPGLEVY